MVTTQAATVKTLGGLGHGGGGDGGATATDAG